MTTNNSISGVILEGTSFEGKLTFQDKMRMDGNFKGEIHSKGQLVVGKTADVTGEIEIGELIIYGTVQGNIKKCDFLQIEDGGKLIADINVKKLEIRPGALFEGNCKMLEQTGAKVKKDNK